MRPWGCCVTSASAALAVLLAGCWTSSPPVATPTMTIEELGARGEVELRSDAPMNLALPDGRAHKRDHATTALLRACRAGHPPSCGTLLQMASTDAALEVALDLIVARCERGDLWSCRSIPPLSRHPRIQQPLRGDVGRLLYQRPRRPSADEMPALRDECRDGFAYSCLALAERAEDPAERDAARRALSTAAREGCHRHVTDDCDLVDSTAPQDDRLAAAEWICQVRHHECHRLGALLLEHGRIDDARTAYERACEYAVAPDRCLELAQLYRRGTLKEPVPGRAARIEQVACRELDEWSGHDPACAERSR